MDGFVKSNLVTSDELKCCTMHSAGSGIATIAQDPEFYICTALLWIRSSERVGNIDRSGASLEDLGTQVREDRPDLGLLHLHRDRLEAAAEALGWRNLGNMQHTDKSLVLLRRQIDEHLDGLPPLPGSTLESRKVRVLIDKTGTVSVSSTVTGVSTQLQPNSLLKAPFMPETFEQPILEGTRAARIYLDLQPTRPSALSTHKTTHRCIYTRARERVQIASNVLPTVEEVLLYNSYGEIIETSNCTIYIKRDEQWITPAAICGPNLGVTRRLALEKGLCKQGTIEIKELGPREEVWLSNAVRGFFRGVLSTDAE